MCDCVFVGKDEGDADRVANICGLTSTLSFGFGQLLFSVNGYLTLSDWLRPRQVISHAAAPQRLQTAISAHSHMGASC